MKDMKKLAEIFKERREQKKYSFRQVENLLMARGVKYTFSSIQKFEKGTTDTIDIEVLTALSKIYGLDYIKMLELAGLDNKLYDKYSSKQASNVSEVDNKIPKKMMLPVYGLASAGNGVLDFDVEMEDFLLPLDFKIPNNSFVIRVHGDSMEPFFLNDDRILVDTSKVADWQFLVDYPVVIQINGERFLKVVKFNNYKPEFHSLNNFYPPITLVEGDEIVCIGVVTDILKRRVGKIKV